MLEQQISNNTNGNNTALSDTPLNNTYIGGYRLTQELASSLGSRTLLAETASSTAQERVVIKWFSTLHLHTTQARQDFLREAGKFRRLVHPAILPVLSAGIYTDTPYLVMPYLSQGSLFDRLQRSGGREWSREHALSLTRRIGQALAYSHQQGIVHGNLKARNLLFSEQDELLLADFSLSSLLHILSLDTSETKQSGQLPMLYVPRQSTPFDDIRALACLSYELWTGQPPFHTSQTNMLEPAKTLPIALSWFDPNIPFYIEEALLKALSPDPADRYDDINAFLRALDPPTAIIPSVLPAALPVETTSPTPDQLPTVPIATLSGPLPPPTPGALVGPPALFPMPAPSSALKNVITPRRTIVRQHWSLFLLAGILCLIIFCLISSQFLARLSASTSLSSSDTQDANQLHLSQSLSTATLTLPASPFLDTPTPTRASTPQVWSTPHLKPTPTPTHAPSPTPTPSPSPHPSSVTGLITSPNTLSPQNCVLKQSWYHCSVILSLSEDASGTQTWTASGDGITIVSTPHDGILTPGNQINVDVQVANHCPARGAVVFTGIDTTASLPWSCR